MITIILLIIACAFFTASEMAFVSSDRIKLRFWASKKRKGAKFALNMLRSQDKLLITTLVGTNLTIVGLSVVASTMWRLKEALVTLLVALIIFAFGETIPKSIASKFKEKFTIIFAKPYLVIYWIFYPLIFIVYNTSISILKLFNSIFVPASQESKTFPIESGSLRKTPSPLPLTLQKFTRGDLRIASKTTLPFREHNMISRLLDFRGKKTKEIMLPKDKILAAPSHLSITLLKQIISESGYSRIPIYKSNIDQIVGIVDAKSLLKTENGELKNIIKPPRFIDESLPVESLLDEVKNKESFFAIVKDKRGKTIGLVTMEDVLEELFGEIEDEYDKI